MLMRCYCCDRPLSDYESTLRHAVSLEFLDTCNKCLEGLNIPTVGHEHLTKTPPFENPPIEENWWGDGGDLESS